MQTATTAMEIAYHCVMFIFVGEIIDALSESLIAATRAHVGNNIGLAYLVEWDHVKEASMGTGIRKTSFRFDFGFPRGYGSEPQVKNSLQDTVYRQSLSATQARASLS